MSAQPTCDTCRFWELIEAHDMYTSGSCNKYAPRPINQMVEALDTFEVRWPVTTADDWCGEHNPKEEGMPDYEGLIRAVEAATGLRDVRSAGEAEIAAHIASMGVQRQPNLADALMDALDRISDRKKPALTGEQVRAAFYEEFGEWFRHPKVETVASETTGPIAEAWDRVAARLTK